MYGSPRIPLWGCRSVIFFFLISWSANEVKNRIDAYNGGGVRGGLHYSDTERTETFRPKFSLRRAIHGEFHAAAYTHT